MKATLIAALILSSFTCLGSTEANREWNRLESELIEMGFKEKELANIRLEGMRLLHERVMISRELQSMGVNIKWHQKTLPELREMLREAKEIEKQNKLPVLPAGVC